MDFCPQGDKSPSYYDRLCGTPSSVSSVISNNEPNKTVQSMKPITQQQTVFQPQTKPQKNTVAFTDIGNSFAQDAISRLAQM